MEEQKFALMLRQVLTEYDFERIDIDKDQANVGLKREVYAENRSDEKLEYVFKNKILIKVLEELKTYLPAL